MSSPFGTSRGSGGISEALRTTTAAGHSSSPRDRRSALEEEDRRRTIHHGIVTAGELYACTLYDLPRIKSSNVPDAHDRHQDPTRVPIVNAQR
ncbi:hypothetical protein IAS59_004338 [Cryptococcus gattii]